MVAVVSSRLQLDFLENEDPSNGFRFSTGQVRVRSLKCSKLPAMIPKPPSSSEGSSLPPRSRPNLGDFVKDSNEADLWDFDEIDSVEEAPKKMPIRPTASSLPAPRESANKKSPDLENVASAKGANGKDSVRVNVGKFPSKARSGATVGPSMASKDLDELDDLDHPEHEPPTLEIHPSFVSGSRPLMELQSVDDEEFVAEQSPSEDFPAAVSPVDESNEFSPVVRENAVPISLIPHLKLSKIEWLGLWVLLGVLFVGGSLIVLNISHRLPTDTGRANSSDFPVKGRHTEILSAETFWRAPIIEGENAETFRRGTQLLPVVNLTSAGAPAAVRVFFRDQDGAVMGDAVTRAIRPGTSLQVAATTGFEDVGMHAAYRTGQSKPWTIEVREAPSESSPNADFKKLFEIEVSTDRR